MIKYALKSLIQDKSKLLLSIFGVSLAILLILIMEGIFAGTEEQLTVYINKTPAQVYVLQNGVENMHMTMSFFPASYKKKIEKVKGVKKVVNIYYLGSSVKVKHIEIPVYLIGWDPKEDLGGPWAITEGKKFLTRDEVIIDKVIANNHDLKIGDKLDVLGKQLKIAGTTEGTFSMVSSILFLNKEAFKGKIPAQTTSFSLVQTQNGTNVNAIKKKINTKLKLAHALTRKEFESSEREIAKKMGIDIISVMTLISLLAAIGVVALSVYSVTFEKIRDFGVLKAIGAGKNKLYLIVISQALFSTIIAALIGVLFSLGIAQLLKLFASEVLVIITVASFVRAFIIAAFIGVIAAYLPVRQIAKVDPVIVFSN